MQLMSSYAPWHHLAVRPRDAVPVKTHITPLLAIESPVVQWLEHPTRSPRVVVSSPIWNFFPSRYLYLEKFFEKVLVFIKNIYILITDLLQVNTTFETQIPVIYTYQ